MAAAVHEFKAEIKQLLDILVHSLYTHKEIFLRELVSNASDALDKFRYLSAAEDDSPLEIRIRADKEGKTLTVSDTGVGMTRDEIMENLGSIGHSGTGEFIRRAAEAAREGKAGVDGLIGRFGVGFYSVYMAADEVEVVSKSCKADEPAVAWKSDGKGAYELSEPASAPARGTEIRIRLKDSVADEFCDPETLKRIVRKHSGFISYPIYVGEDRVNTQPALWREPKFQITREQYAEFYKFLTHDSEEPLDTLHTAVDAPVQYNALLFVPRSDQENVWLMDRENWGPDLYVRRVLIQRQNKELLPQYLSFVKGVVDTEDLPLNISRETLQDNLLLRKINGHLVKQVLGHLENLAKTDADRYADFWRAHGRIFKQGHADYANRERFAGLLRFNSSHCEDGRGLVSLDDYVGRAKADQKEIYYASAPGREAAMLDPHLEIFRSKGLEVLYLFEPLDEFVLDGLREYKEFRLVAAEAARPETLDKFETVAKKEAPDALGDEEAKAFEGLLSRMKDILGDSVTGVRVSARLQDSPCCLASPEGHMTSSMEKIMRVMSKDTSLPKRDLEVNRDHPLLRNLLAVYRKDPQDEFVELATRQLFESAMLLEGYLTDPHALVGRLQNLLTQAGAWRAGMK